MIERELRLLIEEDAIKDVVVIRQPEGGYVVQINGRTLKSARREVRHFARLDTAADLLHKFGLDRFVVVQGVLAAVGNEPESAFLD